MYFRKVPKYYVCFAHKMSSFPNKFHYLCDINPKTNNKHEIP